MHHTCVCVCTTVSVHVLGMLEDRAHATHPLLQENPENEIRKANITCSVYSHDGKGVSTCPCGMHSCNCALSALIFLWCVSLCFTYMLLCVSAFDLHTCYYVCQPLLYIHVTMCVSLCFTYMLLCVSAFALHTCYYVCQPLLYIHVTMCVSLCFTYMLLWCVPVLMYACSLLSCYTWENEY